MNGRHARLSALKPHILVLSAATVAATSCGVAVKQLLASGNVPWVLLILGIAHAVVALACFLRWKYVRSAPGYYIVSDLIRCERISFDDVCMAVEDRGFLWKNVHIHFKRRTRFGWSVVYSAIEPTGEFRFLARSKAEAEGRTIGR